MKFFFSFLYSLLEPKRAIVLSALVLCFVGIRYLMIQPDGLTEKKIQSYSDRAKGYFDSNEYDKSIEVLEKLLEKNFQNLQIYAAIGRCYRKLKNSRKEIETYERAKENFPYSSIPYRLIADTYFQYYLSGGKKKDLDNAIRGYEKASVIAPEEGWPLYNLGLLYQENGQPQKAKQKFKEATEKNDQYYASAKIGLATILGMENNFKDSIPLFIEGLEKKPRSYEGNYRLAFAYMRLKNWTEAVRYYEKALDIEPSDLILIDLVVVCSMAGKDKKAEEYYQRIKDGLDAKVVENDFDYEIGTRFFEKGYLEKANVQAIVYLNKFLAKTDKTHRLNNYSLHLLGQSYVVAGNYAAAIAPFEEVRKGSPKKAHLLFSLAWCYEETENYEKAIKIYDELIKLPSESRFTDLSFIYDLLGKAYIKVNQFDNAKKAFEESLKYQKESAKGDIGV